MHSNPFNQFKLLKNPVQDLQDTMRTLVGSPCPVHNVTYMSEKVMQPLNVLQAHQDMVSAACNNATYELKSLMPSTNVWHDQHVDSLEAHMKQIASSMMPAVRDSTSSLVRQFGKAYSMFENPFTRPDSLSGASLGLAAHENLYGPNMAQDYLRHSMPESMRLLHEQMKTLSSPFGNAAAALEKEMQSLQSQLGGQAFGNTATALEKELQRLQGQVDALGGQALGRPFGASLNLVQEAMSSLDQSALHTFAREAFGPDVARYIQDNPLSKEEWIEAETAINNTLTMAVVADDVEIQEQYDPLNLSDLGLPLPEQDSERQAAAKMLLSVAFLSFICAGSTTVAFVWPNWLSIFVAACINILYNSKVAQQVQALQSFWKSSGKKLPMAKVVDKDESVVRAYPQAHTRGPCCFTLQPGETVLLAESRTKTMRAIVLHVDENGEITQTAWVPKKKLKRVTKREVAKLRSAETRRTHH